MPLPRIPILPNLLGGENPPAPTPTSVDPATSNHQPQQSQLPDSTNSNTMSTSSIRSKLDTLSAAVDKPDPNLESCASMLTELKIALTTLPALQPTLTVNQAAIPDITLARDVYEAAAFLSLKQEDEFSIERHIAQLKTYYVDFASVLPPSANQNLILALNLMRLMAKNRIGEFHTELELIPSASRSDKYIDYALRLEHYLMEGSYSKIREEKIAAPHELFSYFVDRLMDTMRQEIANCSERAYGSLSVEAAQRILSLASPEEVVDFCELRKWKVEKGVIYFAEMDEGTIGVEPVPSDRMIERSLEYARELEQII